MAKAVMLLVLLFLGTTGQDCSKLDIIEDEDQWLKVTSPDGTNFIGITTIKMSRGDMKYEEIQWDTPDELDLMVLQVLLFLLSL